MLIIKWEQFKKKFLALFAVVIKFHDVDEVIETAIDSVYGFGGAVWSKDINKAIKVARAVEKGRIWVNTYHAMPDGATFWGYKESGIGRECHKVILEHYTQMKNIMINLDKILVDCIQKLIKR